MNVYAIWWLCIFCGIGIVGIIVSVSIQIKKKMDRKKYFSAENMIKYEEETKQFLAQKKIEGALSINEICVKLGKKIEEVEKLSRNQEAEINPDNPDLILCDKNLPLKRKNFDIAHEIAHTIRGDCPPVSYRSHGFFIRDIEEQVCDYIAAAILLPMEFIVGKMQEKNYKGLRKRERLQFIFDLSDEVNVEVEVVMRRINEVHTIERHQAATVSS